MPSAPSLRSSRMVEAAEGSDSARPRRGSGAVREASGHDAVLFDENCKFVRTEVRQHVAGGGDERGRAALAGEADHFRVVRRVGFDVDEVVAVTAGIEPLLRHHAPRAPDV